jgi:type II secretion system protein I
MAADTKPVSKDQSGFTLIEVVVAMTILVMFLVPILGAISNGMKNISTAKRRSAALMLAESKMTELEMMPIPDAQGAESGDFPEFPGYTWEYEAIKTPYLELMEENIGIVGMEIHLSVFWIEGETRKSISLQTLLVE